MTTQNYSAKQSLRRRTAKHIAYTVLHLALGFLALYSALHAVSAALRSVAAALTGDSLWLLNAGLEADVGMAFVVALTLGLVAFGLWKAECYVRNRDDLYLAS